MPKYTERLEYGNLILLDGMNKRFILELNLYANGSLGGTHYGAIITKAYYPNEFGVINAQELTMEKVICSL